MPSMTSEALEALKQAPESTGLVEMIRRRWSPRAYANKPLAASDLEKLFVAAGWAASCFNEQPWRFLVGRNGDETYQKIFQTLGEFNQSWAKSAPVLILSAAKKSFSQNGKPNHYALHDTGAATANLALQATALGLHCHSMAGFDREMARASFGIPEDYEIGAVTAIGYLGDPATLPDSMRATETSARQRKPLEEFVFSAWNVPSTL